MSKPIDLPSKQFLGVIGERLFPLFSPNGDYLFVFSPFTQALYVWHLQGQVKPSLAANFDEVICFKLSPDSQFIFVVSEYKVSIFSFPGLIKIASREIPTIQDTLILIPAFVDMQSGMFAFATHQAAYYWFFQTDILKVCRWQVKARTALGFHIPSGSLICYDEPFDREYISAAIVRLAPASADVLSSTPVDRSFFPIISPNASFAVTCHHFQAGEFGVWSLEKPSLLYKLYLNPSLIPQLTFSQDGSLLVQVNVFSDVADDSSTRIATVTRPTSGDIICKILLPFENSGICISQDNSLAVFTDYSAQRASLSHHGALVFSLPSGTLLARCANHFASSSNLALSPQRDWLVSVRDESMQTLMPRSLPCETVVLTDIRLIRSVIVP
jgi:WD40 repeat protein